MVGRAKWNYLSDYEKKIILKDFEIYAKSKKEGYKGKNRDVLTKIFNAYNENVSFSYPRVASAMSCGKCVREVLNFFKKELEKLNNTDG